MNWEKTWSKRCTVEGCNWRVFRENYDYCERHIPASQGMVNAMCVALYHRNKEALKAYTDTLSDKERDAARAHLKTYLKEADNA